MKIPDDVYIWRDPISKEVFNVGVHMQGTVYSWWFSLTWDAISECFGPDAARRAEALRFPPGNPVPLADVLEGKDSADG